VFFSFHNQKMSRDKSLTADGNHMPSKTATVKKVTKTVAKAAPKKTASKVVTKPVSKAAVKSAAKTTAKTVVKTVAKKAAPVKPVTKAANTSMKPAKVTKIVKAEPAAVAPVAKAVKATTPKAPKNDNTAYEYKTGDKVVYPAHGVGCVEGVEKLTVAGTEVTLYTITFEKDRMRLKLPLQKVATSGLRRLATDDQLVEIFQTMKGRARIRRVMWSRRAQEYEAKINSGSPVQVAEVLRDLRRNVSSTEHSYSERQIFQQALERLASEIAAIDNTNQEQASLKLQGILAEAA
jgi:CarD family transcriptional regulator